MRAACEASMTAHPRTLLLLTLLCMDILIFIYIYIAKSLHRILILASEPVFDVTHLMQ